MSRGRSWRAMRATPALCAAALRLLLTRAISSGLRVPTKLAPGRVRRLANAALMGAFRMKRPPGDGFFARQRSKLLSCPMSCSVPLLV